MRKTNYSAAMAYILAVMAMLVFAATPVMAASQEETTGSMGNQPMMQQGMSGQTKAGMQSQTSAETKGETAVQQKPTSHSRAEKSGEVRSGATAEQKAGVSSEHKAGMTERGAFRGERERGMVRGEQERGAVRREATAPAAAKGGDAIVARVDRPDNCLRLRSGPSFSREVIGCAAQGQALHLTGVFSSDGRWAQLDNNGWVFFGQLKSDLKPPRRVATSHRKSSSEDDWWSDWGRPAGAGSGSAVSEGTQMYDYSYGPSSYYYGPSYYGVGSGYGWYRPRLLPPLPPPPGLPRP